MHSNLYLIKGKQLGPVYIFCGKERNKPVYIFLDLCPFNKPAARFDSGRK
jgi:hypothetical protein